MRVLVTGASGFLGSFLVTRLLQQGCEVTILLRETSDTWRIRDLLSKVAVIYTDTAGVRNAEEAITDSKPDIVFHLAWTGGNSYKYLNDPSQVHANIYGSLDLLQIAAQSGAKRWIGFGSVIEYGHVDGIIREDMFPRPDTLYGISKYALCLMTKNMCEMAGLEFAWVRPFWTYGPKDDPLRMIPMVTNTLVKGERPALTPGEQLWDYLYIDDAVEALYQLAIAPEATGLFNLGSGDVHTIRSVVETIRDCINPALPLGLGDCPYRPNQIMHLQSDISRLRSVGGWRPRVAIEVGLRRTVEWHMGQALQKGSL